ncbi:MAG: imelysin family protein [Bacteroidota bacterium]
MNRSKLAPTFLCAMAIAVFVVSCKKEPEEEKEAFDKGRLLSNLSENIILPAVAQFNQELNNLQSDLQDFEQNTTAQQLEVVRESWKQAYLTWQTVKIFDFGPMRDIGMKGATATYPIDTTGINDNVAAGSYNLASASNVDAIGLSAVDYLLYRAGALDSLQNNPNVLSYTADVIDKMVSESNTIHSEWSSYQSTFNASTGTSSTSAFSKLINEYNRDFELAKTAKVGIPLGKQSLDVPLPDYVEARYSGISFELLQASLEALRGVYNGRYFESGTEGVGMNDYLIHLEKNDLNTTIDSGFEQMITTTESFSMTLEEALENDVSNMEALYNQLQGHVVHIKTDMTSAFGVLITYQDNDGD